MANPSCSGHVAATAVAIIINRRSGNRSLARSLGCRHRGRRRRINQPRSVPENEEAEREGGPHARLARPGRPKFSSLLFECRTPGQVARKCATLGAGVETA